MPTPRFSRRAFVASLATAATVAHGDSRRAPALPEVPAELLRLAGTCIVSGFYGPVLPADLRGLLQRGALGGVIIARGNVRSREQLAALCAQISAMAPADARPMIAADQEGGPVAHLSPPLSSFPSMTTLGGIDDPALTRRIGAALGAELRAVGVNTDFAPVLDVRTSRQNMVVLNRVFGREPEKVARHGRALIDGLNAAGMIACAKHFPGHGDTVGDSHAVLPRVAHDLARLDAVELVPFRACLPQTPCVMLAHVVYAGVDPTHPASLSQRVIEGVLREHLGYDGVAVSDDLQMAAIRGQYSATRAAEAAMRAGCDLLLIAHTSAFALAAARHLATVAMTDAALRARLGVAAGRIARLRARIAAAPAPLAAGDGPAVLREVAQRAGGRGAGTTRDPTLRR